MLSAYIKGFLKCVAFANVFLTLYFLLAILLNRLFSPEIHGSFWQGLDKTTFLFLLWPILVYFGLYGMLKIDAVAKNSEKILFKFRDNAIVSFLFF